MGVFAPIAAYRPCSFGAACRNSFPLSRTQPPLRMRLGASCMDKVAGPEAFADGPFVKE